ncbi:hypothetical protein ATKI12_8507 [Kitasatospora sp. Ki12]
MADGGWDDHNPDVISLCSHGACLQGQHRLEAVVISQTTRSFLIVRNVAVLRDLTCDVREAVEAHRLRP